MREVRITLLVLLLAFVAVQVQPQEITLEAEPATAFSEIITVTNTETRPVTYTFVVDPFSTYLMETISPSQETFVLAAQASKNIEVSGTIPALGPETHELTYNIKEGQQTLASTTLLIPIEGNGDLEAGMDVSAQDISAGQTLIATAELTNFGNIIAYYSLQMQIQEQGTVKGEIRYPQRIQVLPGEQQTITLPYTDYLEPGNYVINLVAQVNDEQTLEETIPVIVTLQQETKTIAHGDDLVISLKRYQNQPRVQYTISRNNKVQLEEIFVATNDTITIPTSTLSEGRYEANIQIVSEAGEDTQSFELVIDRESTLNVWAMIIVLAIGLFIFLIFTPVRTYLRILRLSAQISKQEKRLNTLISKLHRMEESIVHRRTSR